MYGVVSLVPVLLLGAALAVNYRADAKRRGIAEGRSEAAILATTAVGPVLDGRPLSAGLSPSEVGNLSRIVGQAIAEHDVLRIRIRDLAGKVVFSDDGSGFNDVPEDTVAQAAAGQVVARLTRLNTDNNDTGPSGVAAVEVYLPLSSWTSPYRVGVLETYLPYAPIARGVSGGLQVLYRDLAVGLTVLWLVLFGISLSVSRGLRRQVRLNAYLAEHDALTDLPNRVLFHRRAHAALEDMRRRRRSIAIAIIDLDRFKEINDTLGHHNGDQVLVELGRRLAATLGPRDYVARLGGDEFGVILDDASEAEGSLLALRALIAARLEVIRLPLSVEASIGYVIAPEDGSDVDQLLQHADVAMYVAKGVHSGVARYDARQDHYDAADLALVGELRPAIAGGQLVLHYQPKLVLDDGRVEAVEALVRWQHPTKGMLLPDRFLPLAEQTELIDRLTTWVLSRALGELDALGPRLSVAVNVSARSLGRPDFAREVIDLLDHHGISPERLTLEITETALLVDPERAAVLLAELSAAGVKISLDDFGCGQTSLGYLAALTIHELKIDKSFVSEIGGPSAHAAIVRSIVELGHNLALRVVAEGVETLDTLEQLRELGCDVAQGYLVSRPIPADTLAAWLRSPDCANWRRGSIAVS